MRSLAALVALGVLLLSGLVFVFHLRLRMGDLYPPYSSLRADPQGLKALYEGLEATGAWDVQRSYRPLVSWRGDGAAIVVVGVDPFGWLDRSDNLTAVQALANAGNRVVVGFNERARDYRKSDGAKNSALAKRWGIVVESTGGDKIWPLVFGAGKEWSVVRSEGDRPVIVQRSFGSGKVLLVASSWLLTNEAMNDDLRPALILQLLGEVPRIRFDETHLGLEERGTVMGLARKYRLDGFLAGLLVLAGLFLWRSTSSFPPRTADTMEPIAAGRDALTGFAILLERNVPASELLATCIAERKKAGHPLSGELIREMEVVSRAETTPVNGFRAVQTLLRSKRIIS